MGGTNAFGLPEPEKLFVCKFGVCEPDPVAELLGQFATEGQHTSNYTAAPSGGAFTYQTVCEMLEKVRDAPMWESAQQQLATAATIHERLDHWFPGWREESGT